MSLPAGACRGGLSDTPQDHRFRAEQTPYIPAIAGIFCVRNLWATGTELRVYAAVVSDIEPHKRPREVAPRRIPHEVVPVPLDHVRELVHDAVRGTSLVNPVTKVLSGWAFFEPYLRFTEVDDTHTRIELDLVGTLPGAEILLYPQRRAEIDRFFVAIQDELDRRERWRRKPPSSSPAIEGTD